MENLRSAVLRGTALVSAINAGAEPFEIGRLAAVDLYIQVCQGLRDYGSFRAALEPPDRCVGSGLRVNHRDRQEAGRIELGLFRGHVTASGCRGRVCSLYIPIFPIVNGQRFKLRWHVGLGALTQRASVVE
jgi:hypothetical protein